MYFYLLLLLGWIGVGIAAAVLMSQFVAAGRGDLGWDDDRRVRCRVRSEREQDLRRAQRPTGRDAA